MTPRPLAWIALCGALIYAGLAVASGFDRIAASAPAAAALVPQALQTGALTGLLRGQGAAPQLPLAERLVSRAPARAEAVSLLGTARLAKGDLEGADRAFRIAALYGWRDAPTQLYWLQTALTAERYDLAALRFDALARQWPDAPAVAQAAAAFDITAEGRAALTERIVAGAGWARVYALASEGEDAAALARRAEVLLAAGRGGRKLGCADIARSVSAMGATDIAAAAALWRAHCPDAASDGAVSDGGFDRISTQAPLNSFEWELPGDGALSTFAVMQGASDKALSIASASALTLPFARQQIPLPPGRYRLSWSSDAGDPVAAARLQASLSCRTERLQAELLPAPLIDGRQSMELTVKGACAAFWLQLWIAPGSGSITIDDVALTRL